MKLAYLILAHAHPAQLQRLINRLLHKDAHFYIHIDLKTPIKPFLYLSELTNVCFIKNRVKIFWGGYSMIQATINGFEEILASGNTYSFISLMSGQDYPIKSTAYIHNYLAANEGKIFMHTLSVYDEWREALPRIQEYNFVNLNFPGKYRVEKLVNAVMPPRKLQHNFSAVGRSQWFTITAESMEYILKYMHEEKWIGNFFKWSWAPDEIIFHTILYNSQFKKDMVSDNLCYVDWSMGGASPKTLSMTDAQKLEVSPKLFARKFDQKISSELLDYLDQTALYHEL